MKKLMIAATALLCGVMAQASTVSWAITGVKGTGGTAMESGHAYVFFVPTASGKADITAFQKSLTKAQLTTALEAASMDYLKSDITADAGVFSYNSTTAGANVSPTDIGLTWGGKYSVYAVITDTDTITDQTHYYVTASTTAATIYTADSQQNKAFTPLASSSATASNWYAVSVPEPTSGLLLLLGMAGFALKRKRA